MPRPAAAPADGFWAAPAAQLRSEQLRQTHHTDDSSSSPKDQATGEPKKTPVMVSQAELPASFWMWDWHDCRSDKPLNDVCYGWWRRVPDFYYHSPEVPRQSGEELWHMACYLPIYQEGGEVCSYLAGSAFASPGLGCFCSTSRERYSQVRLRVGEFLHGSWKIGSSSTGAIDLHRQLFLDALWASKKETADASKEVHHLHVLKALGPREPQGSWGMQALDGPAAAADHALIAERAAPLPNWPRPHLQRRLQAGQAIALGGIPPARATTFFRNRPPMVLDERLAALQLVNKAWHGWVHGRERGQKRKMPS